MLNPLVEIFIVRDWPNKFYINVNNSHYNMTFKVGIAGFGSIGVLHAQIFDTLQEVQTIQVADPNKSQEGRFQFLSKKGAFFDDYRKLEACNCVVIALPTELHAEAVSYFSSRKIPMLIEKPIGLTYEESKRIIETVKREQVPAMCGLTGLYHPEFRAMYEQLRTIGDLVSIHEKLHEANSNLARVLGEERGVLTMNGIHTLHRFYKIASLKDDTKTLEVGNITLDHRYFMMPGEDYAEGILYLGQIPFTFSMSFRNGRKCDNDLPIEYILEIKGTKGIIIVIGYEKCETHYHTGKTVVNYQHPNGPLRMESQYSRIGLGLRAEIQEFIRFLGTKKKKHHTLEEALAGQKLVEECYAIAKK